MSCIVRRHARTIGARGGRSVRCAESSAVENGATTCVQLRRGSYGVIMHSSCSTTQPFELILACLTIVKNTVLDCTNSRVVFNGHDLLKR